MRTFSIADRVALSILASVYSRPGFCPTGFMAWGRSAAKWCCGPPGTNRPAIERWSANYKRISRAS
jgi:hypothetical protein